MATKKIRKIKVFIHAEFKSNDGIFWEMELISDLRVKKNFRTRLYLKSMNMDF